MGHLSLFFTSKKKSAVLLDHARQNNLEGVRTCLGGHANVNHADQHGNIALHFAVQHMNLEMVRLLLSHSANQAATNEAGQTPFQLALAFNDVRNLDLYSQLLDTFINAGIRPFAAVCSSPPSSPRGPATPRAPASPRLRQAAPANVLSPFVPNYVVKKLVPLGSGFYFAANNESEALAVNLSQGMDPNMKTENGMTLLHWACAGDAPECVQVLLDAGANPYVLTCGFQPIFRCLHHSSACYDLVTKATQPSPNIDAGPHVAHKSIMTYAMEKDAEGVVAALIAAGAAVTPKQAATLVRAGGEWLHPLQAALRMEDTPVHALGVLMRICGAEILSQNVADVKCLDYVLAHANVHAVQAIVDALPDKLANEFVQQFSAAVELEIKWQREHNGKDQDRLGPVVQYLKGKITP